MAKTTLMTTIEVSAATKPVSMWMLVNQPVTPPRALPGDDQKPDRYDEVAKAAGCRAPQRCEERRRDAEQTAGDNGEDEPDDVEYVEEHQGTEHQTDSKTPIQT